jgi:hypothetical protein
VSDPRGSYHGNSIINPPVWAERDIAGYLFAGGLAGASSLLAAGADLSRRPRLGRGAKHATTAIGARWPRCQRPAARRGSSTCCGSARTSPMSVGVDPCSFMPR